MTTKLKTQAENKPMGQLAVSRENALRALDTLVDARNCLDILAEICTCGAMKQTLDESPIHTVIKVAIDKVHRGIEILRGDDEIEQEAAS
jgi:hypothetical protein